MTRCRQPDPERSRMGKDPEELSLTRTARPFPPTLSSRCLFSLSHLQDVLLHLNAVGLFANRTAPRFKTLSSLPIEPIPNPVCPITPIDPVPIPTDRPRDTSPLPVRRHTPLAVERSSRSVPILILQRQTSPSLLNRA